MDPLALRACNPNPKKWSTKITKLVRSRGLTVIIINFLNMFYHGRLQKVRCLHDSCSETHTLYIVVVYGKILNSKSSFVLNRLWNILNKPKKTVTLWFLSVELFRNSSDGKHLLFIQMTMNLYIQERFQKQGHMAEWLFWNSLTYIIQFFLKFTIKQKHL